MSVPNQSFAAGPNAPAPVDAAAVCPDFPLFRLENRDGWQKVSSHTIFDAAHVQVEEALYLTPHRQDSPIPWTVVQRKPAVAVVPITEDGRFVLIHQERLPVQQICWEFPAGQIDVPLEEVTQQTVVDTALRELLEETGYALHPEWGELEPLGWFLPSQGFTQEHVYLFKAEPVCVVRRPEMDGAEHISDVRLVSPGELRRMVAENEITTALTLALYARIAAKGSI